VTLFVLVISVGDWPESCPHGALCLPLACSLKVRALSPCSLQEPAFSHQMMLLVGKMQIKPLRMPSHLRDMQGNGMGDLQVDH
jgi:hypothetical protein